MSVAETGFSDRSGESSAQGGEPQSGVSEPLSEQRVSAEAVKGAGKEKENFFPA
ncbi:MAG: hypothetical protein JXA41_13925 [Deltaproteobacteria bacterium]|nr:hypothetical protein [Deltaproteobacteria bacterium]